MQGFRSRNGSSEMQQKSSQSPPNQKRSSSPKITRASSASSDSIESRVSKVFDRKPSHMLQSFPEKQRTMRVPEMQQQLGKVLADMKRVKDERSQAIEELAELKKKNEGFQQSNDRITTLEAEVEKTKESEMKLLESLISQTKQIEQTKILLEEAKLEVRNLRENPGASERKGLLASVQSIQAQEEIKSLRNELRLALQAEEKSKKAMDDFAIALKEVTTEATHAKEELDLRKSELEKTEQKLQMALERYNKLKIEYDDSIIAWKVREDSFLNCVKISEEDAEKKDEENIKLADAHKLAKEENSKLRDIIKQAVNEAMVVKESLAIARNEIHDLKSQISEKESALLKLRNDFDTLKVSEIAALDGAREMKSSNLLDVDPFGQSKATIDDRKISNNMKKFSSDRWENPRIQIGYRRSVDGISFHESENDKQKKMKKKTVFGRFGDALRRRSFRKT